MLAGALAKVAHATAIAPRTRCVGTGLSGAITIRASALAVAYGTSHF